MIAYMYQGGTSTDEDIIWEDVRAKKSCFLKEVQA